MKWKYLIVLTVSSCLEAWHYPRPVYPPPAPLWQEQYIKLRDRLPATLNVIPVNPIAEPHILKRHPDEAIHPIEDHFDDVYPLPEDMYDLDDRVLAIRNVPYYHRERYRLRDEYYEEDERRKQRSKVVKNQLESNTKKGSKESVPKETKESKSTISSSKSRNEEQNEKSRSKSEGDKSKDVMPADPKIVPLEISSHAIPSPNGGVTVVTEMLYDPFKTTNIPMLQSPFLPSIPPNSEVFYPQTTGPNPQPTSSLTGYGSFVPPTSIFPPDSHKQLWNEQHFLQTPVPKLKSSISSLRPFRRTKTNATKTMKSTKSSEEEGNLGATAIAGIIIGSLVSVSLLAGTALFVMYKTQFGRGKPTEAIPQPPPPPSTISNCNYVDRTSIDIESDSHNPSRYFDADTDEEFVSLDNDSFLLSLEASVYENEYAFSFYEPNNTKV